MLQDRLIRVAEDVGARLEYFQELDHATRMLNHPGESLVLQADFLEMVERVDICIEFLRAHVRVNYIPLEVLCSRVPQFPRDIIAKLTFTSFVSNNA